MQSTLFEVGHIFKAKETNFVRQPCGTNLQNLKIFINSKRLKFIYPDKWKTKIISNELLLPTWQKVSQLFLI